jgi:NhaP-type Na+/H+ or K+/H+ antiporter
MFNVDAMEKILNSFINQTIISSNINPMLTKTTIMKGDLNQKRCSTTIGHNKHKREKSSKLSILSITVTVILLSVVAVWHDGTKPKTTTLSSETSSIESHRFLGVNEEPTTIDDDNTRTETCKRYLMNFLNGTTDANDQCQAFYNAYRTADCADETHVDIFGNQLQGDDKNKTTDDVVIDDFFENWECCDYIEGYYEKNCENDTGFHSTQLLGVTLVLLFCTIIKALLKTWNVNWIPDACAFILVGTLVGLGLRLLDSSLVPKLTFDNDLFLQIMLPPIIFQAALSIDKKAFRRDLFPILLFAVVGTGFSAIAIGWMVYTVSNLGGNSNLPWLDSLVFGSLISSIDPVATLSILSGVGVSQTDTLYTLIFGEALLNDGVAIVFFEVLKDHLGEDDSLGEDAYKEMAKNFAIVLCGSIGIGIGVAVCCTLYFWALREKQTAVTEVAIFFCWALIPYYIADGLHCSGIIAIMVMGFFLDYFVIGGFQSEVTALNDYTVMQQQDNGDNRMNPQQHTITNRCTNRCSQILREAFSGRGHILPLSRHHVGFVAEVIASIMETAIFAYLGLFLFNDNKWNLRLNFTAIASCVSSRLFMVAILSVFINLAVFLDFENRIGGCIRSINPLRRINLAEDDDSIGSHTRIYLDRKTQLIMLLAGVRGAVSFALVENIPVWDNVSKTGSKFKAELKTMTSSSIVFTLFVFGALTYMAVKHGSESSSDRVRTMLTNRLLSEPLDNDDEAQAQTEPGSRSFLEIERDAAASSGRHQMSNGENFGGDRHGHGHGHGPHQGDDRDVRYLSSNEWIS